MSLTEKIKQKAKRVDSSTAYFLCTHPTKENCKKSWCDNREICRRKNNAILVQDVLAELTNYKLIPVGKWQQIVEHIKNQPPKSCTNHASLRLYYEEAQKWFEDLEAKVAELKETKQ